MRRVWLVLSLLVVPTLVSCKRNDNCVEKLNENIPLGCSRADAEGVLHRCVFTYSFDTRTSTIYALKHDKPTGLVTQDWSAQIKIDEAGKVASLKVEEVFTGP
jgi:hypothetical protein